MEKFEIHWNSYDKQYHFIIGFLTYENTWTFSYNQETIMDAIDHGFRPFPDMPDITKIYTSSILFSIFQNRFLNYGGLTFHTMKNNTGDLVTDKVLIKYVSRKEI